MDGVTARWRLAAVALALVTLAAPGAAGAEVPWRALDLNGDGRVDSSDLARIIEKGRWHGVEYSISWQPSVDVDGNGKKDARDTQALTLLLTKLDRDGNKVIDQADFRPPEDLRLPAPDAAAALALARQVVAEQEPKLPAGQRSKLQASWAPLGEVDDATRAALHDQAGAGALVARNLDTALWSYATAVTLDPGSESALSNLGFALAQAGRRAEALRVLARALELAPGSCTARNNVGFVLARVGQTAAARAQYAAAATACPKVGQYQLNLGVMMLRQGDPGAAQAFARAASLSRGDREAAQLDWATSPPPPARDLDLGQWAARYQEHYGKEEELLPWDRLGAEERISIILDLGIFRPVDEERKQALAAYVENVRKPRVKAAAELALPKFKDPCDDARRCIQNQIPASNQISAISHASRLETALIAGEYERKKGARMLAMGDLILRIALTEAQRASLRSREPRQEFERVVDQLYSPRMREAQRFLSRRNVNVVVPFDGQESGYASGTAMCVMALGVGGGMADPAYAKAAEKCGKVEASGALTLNLGREETALFVPVVPGVVEIECKPGKGEWGEWKLQVGQGILVAGTWSSEASFGFQVGAGMDLGPAGAATWIKFGSDGSIVSEAEASLVGPGLSYQPAASRVLKAGAGEPIYLF